MKWKRAKRMESRPLPVVLRSRGTTPAERYLSRLCEQTFLSLWSYPGIYRDQGNTRGGDGKEVCDLLVVFGNDIVIFSDKDCSFPSSGDIRMDWSRWFRRARFTSSFCRVNKKESSDTGILNRTLIFCRVLFVVMVERRLPAKRSASVVRYK